MMSLRLHLNDSGRLRQPTTAQSLLGQQREQDSPIGAPPTAQAALHVVTLITCIDDWARCRLQQLRVAKQQHC